MRVPLLFGRKKKVKPVKDGRVQRRKCPECGETTEFREATVKKTYTAYHFVNLWDSEDTAWVCSECHEVFDLDDTDAPELTAKERAQQDAIAKKEAKIAAKNAELAEKQRKQQAQQREAALDDELADMKKKLGLD